MSTLNTPVLRFEVEGKGVLTDDFIRENILPIQKSEGEIVAINTDGFKSFKPGYISTINYLFVQIPQPITGAEVTTLRISHAISGDIDIDIAAPFILLRFSSAWGEQITDLALKTTATVASTHYVRVYEL